MHRWQGVIEKATLLVSPLALSIALATIPAAALAEELTIDSSTPQTVVETTEHVAETNSDGIATDSTTGTKPDSLNAILDWSSIVPDGLSEAQDTVLGFPSPVTSMGNAAKSDIADDTADSSAIESPEAATSIDKAPADTAASSTEPVAEAAAAKQGWYDLKGTKTTAASIPQGANWFDNGVMARSKEVYDPQTDAWYWFDADGICARNKDVYLRSSGGKWVRYDINGRMIKGEDYRYGGWYWFDLTTGAMAKSWKYVPSNGGKWVYYDPVTGQMAHGEKYVTGSGGDGWCYFDEVTGKVYYGWKYVNSNGGKWVYYDMVTGRMAHGEKYVTGSGGDGWCYFDEITGKVHYGWKTLGDGRRVFYDLTTGRMVHGIHTVDGKQLRFNNVTGAYEGEVASGNSGSNSSVPSGNVCWLNSGYAYHRSADCRSLARSNKNNLNWGSVADAQAKGKSPCSNCWH